MPATYRYAGEHLLLSAGRWNEQKKNMGMLELNVNKIFPTGQEILILSLKSFDLPGRSVPRKPIEYLNGTIHYPDRPEAQGELTAVFRDYIDSLTRKVLERWFQQVFNVRTGKMTLRTRLVTTGNLVLFGSDGVSGLRRYFLRGLFPLNAPPVSVDFTSGDQMEMEVKFNVDVAEPL